LGGLVTLRGAILALCIPLFLFWAYGLLHGPDSLSLKIERELGAERVAPNTPVTVRVMVTNLGPSLDLLSLADAVPASLEVLDGSHRHLVALARGASFSFEYQVRGPRGAYAFEKLCAEASDQLGLVAVRQQLQTWGHVYIYPVISRIREVRIRPRRTRVYAGSIPARVGGAGAEFFGVRAYVAGDSPRRINWRASARHAEELFSNDFQQERVADVAIVLDGRERSNLRRDGDSLFEHSVLAAGTLADALLHQGNRVGLLIYSQYLQWTFPAYGKVQRERILSALSRAEPGSSQVFEGLQYLPARLFPPQSQIVLVSPLLPDDYSTLLQLRARGYQVLVVSPDPVAFEEQQLPARGAKYTADDVRLSARIVRLERAWLLARLRRAGVEIVEWNVTQSFDEATRRAFHRAVRPGMRT
jgi:uncharacterized protein (DUF58 family)